MRTPRPWKVTKLAQGQVRERISPGKVVSELREEMLKDKKEEMLKDKKEEMLKDSCRETMTFQTEGQHSQRQCNRKQCGMQSGKRSALRISRPGSNT